MQGQDGASIHVETRSLGWNHAKQLLVTKSNNGRWWKDLLGAHVQGWYSWNTMDAHAIAGKD